MFTPDERLIYEFADHSGPRKADPLEVWRRLQEVPDFNLELDLKLAGTDTPVAAESRDRVTAAVREAFDVGPYEFRDGQASGLVDADCVELLLDYAAFMEVLRRDFFMLPTPAPSTAPASGADVPSGTAPGAGSCSTASAASTGSPAPSPSA